MKKKSILVSIGVFILIILIAICVKTFKDNQATAEEIDLTELTSVYVATGGGKEDFLADEDVLNIFRKKYKLNPVYDSWSNGKLIINPLEREDGSKYDLMFCSDQRFYDYYQLARRSI